ISGGATWTSHAGYGSALVFDGVNDRVTAANVALGAAFTMMAWVYNPSNTAFETILTVGSNRDLYLRNGVITFYDGSTDRSFGNAISRKRWHHVAVVSDGSSLRVYLDGAPSGTSQAVAYDAVTGVLQVGAWIMGSSSADFFGGRIDEVRVYSRALTQAEIQSDMNTPIAPKTDPPDRHRRSRSQGASRQIDDDVRGTDRSQRLRRLSAGTADHQDLRVLEEGLDVVAHQRRDVRDLLLD